MTRPVSLAELRTRALDAADLQTAATNQWASGPNVSFMVNDSASELFDLLLMRWSDYFLTTLTIPLVNGNETYPLPQNFYKVRGVYWVDGTGYRRELTPWTETERADLYCSLNSLPTRYKCEDANLIILPKPGTGSVELRYIYQYPWMYNDTDTLNFQIVSGWDTYIVYDVASKLRVKARQDAALIQATQAMRDRIGKRIEMAGADREAGGHHKIRDTYGWSVMRRRAPRRA